MKVTYIKTKETDFDDLEYQEDLKRLFSKYFKEDDLVISFSIEEGFYISFSEDYDKKEVHCIIFADDKLTNDVIYIFSNSNFLIDKRDITIEVKSNMCMVPAFIKLFKSEDSDRREKSQLEVYLDLYTTKDDILDKINIYGIDFLTEKDKKLLDK